MTFEQFLTKLTSRKFLLAVAAMLAALATGLAGVVEPETCLVMAAVSAGIYAFCEAWVDGKATQANTTVTTKNVTATSADKATVVAAFSADKKDA